VARFAQNYLLMCSGFPPIVMDCSSGGVGRYKALLDAFRTGVSLDLLPFVRYMTEVLEKTMQQMVSVGEAG